MDPVLSIRNLSLDFATPEGPVHALRKVNFDVPRNHIVGIVGESGSGKSTVISAAMRLLANNAVIRSGEVMFNGRDILCLSPQELRALRGEQISMVFQDPMTSQIPVHTIGKQMTDIQYRRSTTSMGEKRRLAIDMLRRVGISDPEERLTQYPHQFSGGMRQRISIAMALLMNPQLLIADEPTTALDVTMEAQIIHLLRELKEDFEGSILFVSHNLGLIAELCDYVVVMYAGQVIEKGSVEDLFYRASHPYTQALLECDPARIDHVTPTLPTISGDVPDLHIIPNGCVFAPRCPKAMDKCWTQDAGFSAISMQHTASCHLLGYG
jgi:oligopeptide/dipeptide ABC transporter ATP-binding protein